MNDCPNCVAEREAREKVEEALRYYAESEFVGDVARAALASLSAVPAQKEERERCAGCAGTGKVPRLKTADHILTDAEPWAWCPNCGGKGTILRSPAPQPEEE